MLLTFVFVLITVCIMYRQKTQIGLTEKLVIFFLFFAIFIEVSSWLSGSFLFKNRIEKHRNPKETSNVELKAKSGFYKGEFEIPVGGKEISSKEAYKLIEKAKKEIEKSISGSNEDLEHVSGKLYFKESYQDGKVSAYFEGEKLIQSNGEVDNENLKTPKIEILKVHLKSFKTEELYEIPVKVIPLDLDTKEGLRRKIKYELMKEVESGNNYIELPTRIGKHKIHWSVKTQGKGVVIAFVGMIVVILTPLIKQEKDKEAEKKNQDELYESYVSVVEKLLMFLQCGMSVRKSFFLIRDLSDRGNSRSNKGYQVILKCVNDLENGVPEINVYENLGVYAGIREYKKLAMILSQNLRSGNERLVESLEKEVYEARAKKLSRMKIKGELISTKLIVPLMMLLLMIMLVLIVPGLWGIAI
ncbi:MAG: type II secretion system F family protein [Lachnospiraceae bacterium]|nr:type II secretion system F family protein [Lachnospiraceae bacterium]